MICEPLRRDARFLPDPVVAFEVSPGSFTADHVHKLREYLFAASIRRCVVVEQTEAFLTDHCRSNEGPWTTVVRTAEETLDIPELGIAIPVAALYAGVELEIA